MTSSDIVFLFAAAGLVLYVASRAAADALTPASDPSPGRMAFAQWLPIAATALIATLAGHSEVGIGLAFATSVAALALVLGILLCVANNTQVVADDTPAWPFIVPAAIFALLAGFRGALTWWHALCLLAIGATVLAVWIGKRADRAGHGFPVTDSSPDHAFAVVIPPTTTATHPPLGENARRKNAGWQFVLSIALAIAGAWLAYKAIIATDQRTRVATTGLVALAVVSPLLMLPLLGTTATAAHHNRTSAATGAIVGIVLLNLCLLLPLVVFAHYVNLIGVAWLGGARTSDALLEAVSPMPFPLAVWRVDTVLLIVIGLLLIPVSQGRWTLRKIEGLLLAFIYAAYLIISTAIAVRL